jgi:hypothetical protein
LTDKDCDFEAYKLRTGDKWDTIQPRLKTLANGGASLRHNDKGMRALFNGPSWDKKGAYLTMYCCGELKDRAQYNLRYANALSKTHARSVAESGFEDGKGFAATFPTYTAKQVATEMLIDNIAERAQLLPRMDVKATIREFIMHTGLGYLANSSSDKTAFNVRLEDVLIDVPGGKEIRKVLVATKDIRPFQEYLSPYRNHDKSII